MLGALYARDWDVYGDAFADGYSFEDRREGLKSTHGKAEEVDHGKAVADLTESVDFEIIETHGEDLLLYRGTFVAGDFVVAALIILQTNADERIVLVLVFDEDAEEAAREALSSLASASG